MPIFTRLDNAVTSWLLAILIACIFASLSIAYGEEITDTQIFKGKANKIIQKELRMRLKPPFMGLHPGEVFIDVEPSEKGHTPFPVKSIRVHERTNSSITLIWHDRSTVEDGTTLRRIGGSAGGWEEVATWGPVSGFVSFTDTDLAADMYYCYQFMTFNEHGESYSPQRCANTTGEVPHPVYRAQLKIKTSNIRHANTDDKVKVRLNSPPGLYVPSGNITVLDYGQNDFELGDEFTYDLELTAVNDLSDITLINISKEGSDGWCIEAIELLVNNRRVFRQGFESSERGCLWLDNEGGAALNHTIFKDALRSYSDWRNYQEHLQLKIPRDEIESRIEGMVGNLISGDNRVSWGDKKGRAWVEATKKSAQGVHIDLDLEGESWWTNPSIDIDFDLFLKFSLKNNQWEMNITTANLESNVDFDWFTNVMGVLLPCGPAVSVVLDEGIPDCITALEDHIAERVNEGWQPIAKDFVIGRPCPVGHPEAIVSDTADISLGCVIDEDEDLGDQ